MEDRWNDYLDSENAILKNKLGFSGEKDRDSLSKAERKISLEKLSLLYLNPIDGALDAEHLKKIHRFIFEDIYPFAGEYREVDIEKNHFSFRSYKTIEPRLEATLKLMQDEIKNVHSVFGYAYFLAGYYNELIIIHPFREGNGRSIREFFREFVLKMNDKTDFEDVELDFTKMNKERLLLGTTDRYLYPGHLEMEFTNGLVPITKKDIKKL